MKEFIITDRQSGQRLDKYLFKIFEKAPKSFIYKMLRKKNIVLNNKKAGGNEKLHISDSVKIYFSDETFEKFSTDITVPKKKNYHLNIIFEDSDILILNKPSNVLSQKASSDDVSINEQILSYLIDSKQLFESDLIDFRPSIANRLDRNTSGLILAGKTVTGLQQLANCLKNRSLKKFYRCMVAGEIRAPKLIKGFLTKDSDSNKVFISEAQSEGSQPICTYYQPIRVFSGYSYLEIELITGRSHQIRAHLASIGHPIIGDRKYGNKTVNDYWKSHCNVKSQMLHSYRMVFPDGREYVADLPNEFKTVLERLS